MTELGHTAPPAALRDVISAAQGAGALTFGAWLGLRRCNKKLGSALYAEIPDAAADIAQLLVSQQIIPTLAAFDDRITLKMVSYSAWNGDLTVHFDTTCSPAEIVPALAAAGQVSAEPLLKDIGVMLQAGAAFGDPHCALSFSFTQHRDGSVPSLVLEVGSKAMFGSDANIGAMVRNYTGDHMQAYTGLADLLAPAPDGKTHHGKIGLQAQGDACPTLSIGVAAPWWSADEQV